MDVSSVPACPSADRFSVSNDDLSFTTASTSARQPDSSSGNEEIEIFLNEEKMTPLQRGTGSGIGCDEIEKVRNDELQPHQWGRTYRIGCDEIEEIKDEHIPPPPPQPSGTNWDSERNESRNTGPRVYKSWKGNNTFIFHGRLIFGPGLHGLVATMSLIIAPVVAFCVIIATKFMDDFPNHIGLCIIIIVVALTLSDIVVLLFVSGRDPGIIPRYKQLPELPVKVGDVEPFLIINGRYVELKFCNTCKVYRPPRTSHCHLCDNCIQVFDHHCPWMSQCVGRQNYGFFYMFIITTTLLSGIMFGFCWIFLVKLKNAEHKTLWKVLGKSVPTTVLTIYTFLECFILLGFSVFHTFLICVNQTTYEFVQGRFDDMVNPYDRGIFLNFRKRLIPSSIYKINFREREEMKTSPSHVQGKITKNEVLDVFLEMIAKKDKPATEPTREDVAIGENLATVDVSREDAEVERKAISIDAEHAVNSNRHIKDIDDEYLREFANIV